MAVQRRMHRALALRQRTCLFGEADADSLLRLHRSPPPGKAIGYISPHIVRTTSSAQQLHNLPTSLTPTHPRTRTHTLHLSIHHVHQDDPRQVRPRAPRRRDRLLHPRLRLPRARHRRCPPAPRRHHHALPHPDVLMGAVIVVEQQLATEDGRLRLRVGQGPRPEDHPAEQGHRLEGRHPAEGHLVSGISVRIRE